MIRRRVLAAALVRGALPMGTGAAGVGDRSAEKRILDEIGRSL